MNKPLKLINFNIPFDRKSQFDDYCTILGKTRSQVLNDMIIDFLISNAKTVDEIIQKKHLLSEIQERPKPIMGFKEFIRKQAPSNDQEEPLEFFSSEHD